MKQTATRLFYKDDEGFTTPAMALAVIITLSLLASAAQVYRIHSTAASVQNVADAASTAAEKQVASFYLVAQVCDSVVFSLSLGGTALVGIGIVAACVPPTQTVSAQLVQAGRLVLQARTKFASAAVETLNRIQELLPIFAALDAAMLAQANHNGGSTYWGIAMLVPFEGKGIAPQLPQTEEEVLGQIEGTREQIEQAAALAEQAAQEANEHKQRAFQADCGAAPDYCMYERAQSLAGMNGGQNPRYASVDTWSFSVALRRAQEYYQLRFAYEQPASESVVEQARSAIRKHFYRYAVNELAAGFVSETQDSFEAYFPLLPKNTAEMRNTSLYTEDVYPCSEDADGAFVMHAWEGCPAIDSVVAWGSVGLMEAESMPTCPVCDFTASSVGKVAAASSSIENGFEYHYRIVAEEAACYQKERAKLSQSQQAVKGPAQRIFDTLGQLFSETAKCRIQVSPPGRIGAIAVVCATGGANAQRPALSGLVADGPSLGARVAVSAATLANDDASETDTIISSLFDNILHDATPAALPATLLNVWSYVLVAYSQTGKSISYGVEQALNSLPLVGAAGLGTWAARQLQEKVDAAGFSPPDLVSRKPVVVNSYHVAMRDGSPFGQSLIQAKDAVSSAYGPLAQEPLSALVSVAGGKILASYDNWDATFVVARIELCGEEGPSVPIEITLPQALKDSGSSVLESVLSAMLAGASSGVEVRRWE